MSANTDDTSRSGDHGSSMNPESRKTWMFAGAAAACLAVTGLVEVASRPAEIEEYGKVGQEFYPEFTDPTLASALTVSMIDAEQVKPLSFSVKQADKDRWVIPSHHNYPADAADQLAKTASSIIGIKRDAMVTRWASDHARYGVVDPETDAVGVDQLEGIGKRLTLRGKDDGILASYIIGKQVDEESDQYYVRHPGEDETYIAELDISLSTKFTDWVNTDLLDIENADVRRVDLNDYSFDEIRGTVTGKIESELSRDSSTADWKIDGIDENTQEVDADAIRDTVDELANLKIVGVRPKQPGLTADLKLDRDALGSQRDVDRLQSDLLSRGFLLQPSQSDPETLTLISREGEMSVGTEDGLFYKLHFGRVFTGSEKELEIGLTSSDDEKADASDDKEEDGDSKEPTSDESDDSEQDAEDSEEASKEGDAEASSKPGRYVFVRVELDESLLGDKPNPVEPEMPAELKEAEKEKEESADAAETDESDSDAKQDDAEEGAESDEGDADGDQAEKQDSNEEKLQKLRDEYNDAKQKYQDDLKALEEFDDKVKEGKEKAEDLNLRFAQWYYVIPGDSYDKLSLSREDLIKAKEKEEEETADGIDDSKGPTALQPPTNQAEVVNATELTVDDANMKEADAEPSAPSEPQTPADDTKTDSEESSKAAAEEKPVDEPGEKTGEEAAKEDAKPTSEESPESDSGPSEQTDAPAEDSDAPAEESEDDSPEDNSEKDE